MKGKMKSLIGFPVEEKACKVDLELHGRHTAYSSEILRLDLLGIAGYGFLLKDIVLANSSAFSQRIHDM